MNPYYEDKLDHYRHIEKIISNVEKDQAKLNETSNKKSTTKPYYIGPANELLRFLYILEKQNENDSDAIRAKAREDVINFIESQRVCDEPDEEETTATEADDQSIDIPQQPIPPSNPVVNTVPQPEQQLVFQPVAPTNPVVTTVPQPEPQPIPQPPTPGIRLSPVTNPNCITPARLQSYETLLVEARQYEQRYKLVDDARKKQLAGRLRDIINKLRTDTFVTLTDELFRYLNGEEQKVGTLMVRVNNNDERLLCLSMLSNLILRQLLGGDLTDVKTEVFIPLITKCGANPQQKEFSTIFLEHLHKKCPYTVPCYPEHDPNMSNEQYLQTLGYIKKKEGDQDRLETDSEFFNRMSGFIRLFCKLLVSRGPPFDNSLSYAWEWFSSLSKLPARENITAILIRVFLDEAGENMIKEYRQQFVKVIRAVREYIPELQKNTSTDQMSRLQLTLDKFPK